jgi:nucleoside-diphosphate-sugar epimerase
VVVLVAGAHGRLGQRIVALLHHRGYTVRALVRSDGQATALRELGVEAVVGDLHGDIEWAVAGCDCAVFAAGASHRGELAGVDAGGAAKLAEAADHYELSRFILCSVIGANRPHRRSSGAYEFLEAKRRAEAVLARLELRWTSLRFGALTEAAGTGRIATAIDAGQPLTLSRDDAALAVAEALTRSHLAHQAVAVVDGDRAVGDAFDAISPRPLPLPIPQPTGRSVPLGVAQSDNPPDDPDMIMADAAPLDADVEWEGDGPLPPEPVGNEDPSPGVP